LKQFFKEYFSFTKSERNGVIVLLTIIALLIVFPQFAYLIKKNESIDFSEFEKEIDDFEASLIEKKTENQYETSYSSNNVFPSVDSVNYFSFNPNTITETEWQKLGLSDKLIKTILNYRTKGGKFYKKEDLKKMYGMPEDIYDTLQHYIIVENKKKYANNSKSYNNKYNNNYNNNYNENNKSKKYNNEEYNIVVEINSADQEELVKLRGIGAAFSERIIDKRNSLGGFVEKEQLLEVYGLKSETFEMIKDHIIIDLTKVKKINLNKAEFGDLIRHPYIDKETTILILKYRDKANIIYSVDELLENNVLTNDMFNKLKHYLSTE